MSVNKSEWNKSGTTMPVGAYLKGTLLAIDRLIGRPTKITLNTIEEFTKKCFFMKLKQ